jgi:TPR repeat protein
MLGFMYDLGEGVPENDWVASTWYKAAAEQGATDAQLNLGVLLADGDGVRRDEVEAYKWLELASRAKEEEVRRVALDLLVTLSGRMTETQIGVARKLVREWEQRQLVRNPR